MRPRYHWGTSLWKFIHTITLIDFDDPDVQQRQVTEVISILHGILAIMPCKKCIESYQEFLQSIDASHSERMALFRHGVAYHNQVNQKLGKPQMSYEDAVALWST
jgi:enoyl reductase-like protein